MEKEVINQLLTELDQFTQSHNLTKKRVAKMLSIPYSTYKKWFLKTENKKVPSSDHIARIRRFLNSQEGEKRAVKIKSLLLLLEDELSWFSKGKDEDRQVFRDKLDLNDVGYISSLLTMLGDEEKFKRWLALTTNKFKFFGKGGFK